MSPDPQAGPGAPASTGGLADPHAGQRVETRGAPLGRARAAVICAHGRNAGPRDIIGIADVLENERVAYFAPAAAGNTWYPYSFLSPIQQNEPYLSSALSTLDRLVGWVEEQGMPASRIVLLGFSQGACLSSEYAVRHARRLGGVVAYSGGVIGPPGTLWEYPGSFEGTPVFLGCSDVDAHVPLARVNETEQVFRRMGAEVTKRIYPGMGHLVSEDELEFTRTLLEGITR
jgi:predicted esterase